VTKNRRSGSHRRRGRGWRIFLVISLAAGAAAYPLYRWQSHRNTLRLLADAKAARSAGNTEDAVRAYRAYLQRASNDVDALREYTEILWARLETSPESIGETVRAFRRLNRLSSDDLQTMRRLTQLHLAVHDFVSAEELASRWSQTEPDEIEAVLLLAQARHGLGKNAETAQLLADAATAKPNQARFYPPLIELLTIHLNRPDEAKRWVDLGLQSNPDAYEVRLAASAYFDRRSDRAAAEEHLNHALRLAPDAPRVLIAAAAFYVRNDRLDLGETYLARAKTAAPLDRSMLSAWTEFALKTGRTSELEHVADALATQASEQDPEFFVQATAMQIRARRFDKADEFLAKLATMNVDSVASALPLLGGARALFADEPYAALPLLERAVALRPQDAWAAELLALTLGKVGATEESDAAYRHVLTLSSHARSARIALARSAWRRGECEQVRELLDATLSPSNANASVGADADRPATPYVNLLCRVCDLELANGGRALPADAADASRWAELSPWIERTASDSTNADLVVRACKLVNATERIFDIAASKMNADPPDVATVSSLGKAALNDELTDVADRIAILLTQRLPTEPDGYALRAAVMASKDQAADAVRYVEQCSLNGEALGRVWQSLAETLFGMRRHEDALQPLRSAIAQLPRDSGLQRTLARHAPELAEGEAAVSALRALEGDSGFHWRYERAALLLRLKPDKSSSEEAAPLLKACVDHRPSWIAARLLLGLAEETRGNDEAAADAYAKVIAEQPPSAISQTALRLVEVLKRLGRFDEADATLDRFAGAANNAPDVLRLQTQRYLRNKNIVSAVDAAEQLLSLRSDDPAWANLTADLQLRAGNAPRAEQIAREQLEKNPSSTPALWSLARALLAQSRPEDAERTVRTQAESQKNAQQFILLAQLLAHLKRPDDAAAAIEHAMTLDPNNAAVHGAASDFWAARGDRAKQLAEARQAVVLRDENPGESLVLARILTDAGAGEQRTEAAAIVARRLKSNPNDVPALMLEARLAGAAEPPDIARAESSLAKVLAIEPKSASAHRLLAGLQLGSGRPAKAFDTVTSGLNANPNDPDLLTAAAELHAFRGEFRAAIPLLRRALAQNPSQIAAKRLLVTAYQHTGQLDLAEQLFSARTPAAELSPLDSLLLARIMELKGNTTRAEDLLRHAAEVDDGAGEPFREYLYFLARKNDFEQVYAAAGDRRMKRPDDIRSYMTAGEILAAHAVDEALIKTGFEWLQDVADHHRAQSDDALFRIALSHYQRGNFQQAEPAFLKAVERNPRSAGCINALAWMYTEDLGKPEASLALLEKFVAGGGRETVEMLDTHAATLHRLGKLDRAKAKLTECLAAAGQTPTLTAATYRLGRIHWDAGNKSEAVTYLRDALGLHKRLGGLTDAEVATAQSLIGG